MKNFFCHFRIVCPATVLYCTVLHCAEMNANVKEIEGISNIVAMFKNINKTGGNRNLRQVFQ